MSSPSLRLLLTTFLLAALVPVRAADAPAAPRLISLALRDTPLVEVFDMLARSEKVNIVLGKGITGNVSVNLYDISLDQAIKAAAEAGGYVAERRGGTWLIVDRKELGLEEPTAETDVVTTKLQYVTAKSVAEILTKHLSRYGKVTPLTDRNMVVVEDRPESLAKIDRIVRALDKEPRQILMEARILEITLNNSETFGIDWRGVLKISNTMNANVGMRGQVSESGTSTTPSSGAVLAPLSAAVTGNVSPEFFAAVAGTRFAAYLSALATDGRVNTLATPRLLVMDGQEAKTQIGTQTGYSVTTTINQVTSQSIQFLDAGVILKVTPSVDERNRILLKLQPEISSATVTNNIPSKATTSVTTNVIALDGETVFIGGLIKSVSTRSKQGIPVLSDLPLVGGLFGYRSDDERRTETIVLITPRLVGPGERGGLDFMPAEAMPSTQGKSAHDH